MTFSDLRLAEPLLQAIASEGYTTPTPIQAQAIPPALLGRDILGCAQTGTGKTAAFALPILHRLFALSEQSHEPRRRPRSLVLCPTRELAAQISDSFRTYGRNLPALRLALVFGGVSERPQIDSLRRGVDVIIATPGRLLDLMNQGYVDLRAIEVLVLDEADRMLDMGFINDIRKIVGKLPQRRQTMLFSATIPAEIRRLADTMMNPGAPGPVAIHVAPPASAAAAKLDESVYFVDRQNKPELLAHLVDHLPMTRAIVFTRTKHGADRVVRHLYKRGIRAEAIHGNKSQNARNRALDEFRRHKIPVLVATDIASRGIDVDGITHVVNYDLTHEPETYIHRIGRTARAGASGAAVSFCDREERPHLHAIEKLTRRVIPVRSDQPAYAPAAKQTPDRHAPSKHASAKHPPHRHAAGKPAITKSTVSKPAATHPPLRARRVGKSGSPLYRRSIIS